MKKQKQIPIIKILIHAAVVLIAAAVVSSARAATVAFGDFNNDGLMDMAAITSPTTVTISLASPNGGYTVSAILTAPGNLPMGDIFVGDFKADGKLDISVSGSATKFIYRHTWLGNGNDTFGKRNTSKLYPGF
jgi:hypothetical protein